MRGLTLTQPWAQLVAAGAKRIETRSWYASYSGKLLIHAAKGWTRDDQELCFLPPFFECLSGEFWLDESMLLPRGAIVATAYLDRCVPTEDIRDQLHSAASVYPPYERDFGNYDVGRWAWLLSEVRRLPEPIPCRGALGLWVPPAEVIEQVRAQLREVLS